jgi:hypothetical protein
MNQTTNAFQRSILYYDDAGDHVSNWTRGVSRALAFHNFDEVPYQTSQLLEPSILSEVARDAALTRDEIERFEYDITGPAAAVKWLLEGLSDATQVQRLNLAACLASTARYAMARAVLRQIDPVRLFPEQQFVYFINKFVIDNRIGDISDHSTEFQGLKAIIENAQIPERRVLDAASQAIVWYVKTGSVGHALYSWFVERGWQAVQTLKDAAGFRELIALSCFYRAHAMIPAAAQDITGTRENMRMARAYASAAQPKSPLEECCALDARKTVLESSLKEMLYLAEDLDAAEYMGEELIRLDPNWSISYHELAEVQRKREKWADALDAYGKAREIGLPRATFSQYMIGVCRNAVGDHEGALSAFEQTLELDPTNISAGVNGYRLARAMSDASQPSFAAYIARWEAGGLLRPEHKELLT